MTRDAVVFFAGAAARSSRALSRGRARSGEMLECAAETRRVGSYNDFHLGIATKDWTPLSDVLPALDALGRRYHTGTLTWHPDGSLLTLFAMAPNGITLQLHNMAAWTYEPTFPPVLGHDGLCGMGPPQCDSTGHCPST